MSQENVEAVKRAVEAGNRRDVEAFLEELDPHELGGFLSTSLPRLEVPVAA